MKSLLVFTFIFLSQVALAAASPTYLGFIDKGGETLEVIHQDSKLLPNKVRLEFVKPGDLKKFTHRMFCKVTGSFDQKKGVLTVEKFEATIYDPLSLPRTTSVGY